MAYQRESLLLTEVCAELLDQTSIHGPNGLGIVGKNEGLLLLGLVENADGILLRGILNIVEDATSKGIVLVLGIIIIVAKEGLLRKGAGVCLILIGEGAKRAFALTGLEGVGIGLVLTEKSFVLILILALILEDIASLA